MLNLLLLAVHALPFHVHYKTNLPGRFADNTLMAADHSDGSLTVGTTHYYIAKVIDATRWNGLTLVKIKLGDHTVTSWHKGEDGVYLTNTFQGRLYRTYLPDITNLTNTPAIQEWLDYLVGGYDAISKRPGMTSGDIVDFVVPKTVQDVINKENPTPTAIIAALPELDKTMQALHETKNTLASFSLSEKHMREQDELRTKLAEEQKRIHQSFRNKREALDMRHQSETDALEKYKNTIEVEIKRIEDDRRLAYDKLQKQIKEEEAQQGKGPILGNGARLLAINAEAKKKTEDLEKQKKKYEAQASILETQHQLEHEALNAEIRDVYGPPPPSNSFGHGNQYPEEISLQKKQKAEWDHLYQLKSKIEEMLEQLNNKLPTFLTVNVANALDPQSPAAVQAFLELALQHLDCYHNVALWNLLLPILKEKVDNVHGLDLTHAHLAANISTLLAYDWSVPTRTSHNALATATVDQLQALANQILTRYNPQLFTLQLIIQQYELTHPGFNFSMSVTKSENAHVRNQAILTTLQKGVEEYPRYDPKQWNDQQALLEQEDEIQEDYAKLHPEFTKIRDSMLGKRMPLILVSEMAKKYPDQSNWKELAALLSPDEVHKRSLEHQALERASLQLYEPAFTNIVAELNRRLDATATSDPTHQRGFLIGAAKNIWETQWRNENNENAANQEKIEQLSPEAAQILQNMLPAPTTPTHAPQAAADEVQKPTLPTQHPLQTTDPAAPQPATEEDDDEGGFGLFD